MSIGRGGILLSVLRKQIRSDLRADAVCFRVGKNIWFSHDAAQVLALSENNMSLKSWYTTSKPSIRKTCL